MFADIRQFAALTDVSTWASVYGGELPAALPCLASIPRHGPLLTILSALCALTVGDADTDGTITFSGTSAPFDAEGAVRMCVRMLRAR